VAQAKHTKAKAEYDAARHAMAKASGNAAKLAKAQAKFAKASDMLSSAPAYGDLDALRRQIDAVRAAEMEKYPEHSGSRMRIRPDFCVSVGSKAA
jgi:hypothetical protein